MQVEVDERVQEFRAMQESSKTDPLFQAYRSEITAARDAAWVGYHSKGVPFSEENVEYMKSRLAGEMQKVDDKYRRLSNLYRKQESGFDEKAKTEGAPSDQEVRDMEELHRILQQHGDKVAEMHDDPILRSFRELMKEQFGYDVPTDSSHFTPQELQRTKEFMQSEESRIMLQHFEEVLSDDALDSVGMRPEDGNTAGASVVTDKKDKKASSSAAPTEEKIDMHNDRVWVTTDPRERRGSKQQQQLQQETGTAVSDETLLSNAFHELRQEATASGDRLGEDREPGETEEVSEEELLAAKMFNPVAMDNLKHMMRKEAQENPEIAQLFMQQFGRSLDEMLTEFESDMKSGRVLRAMDDKQIEEGMKRAKEMAERKTVKRD